MRILVAVYLVSLLNGCVVYSSKDDCIYGLLSTQCFGKEYTSVAAVQKPYSLGKTDTEQRWKDVMSCGGKYGDSYFTYVRDRMYEEKYRNLPHRNGEPVDKEYGRKFHGCMKNKGYIYVEDCGRKNSTTDKRICNE